MRPLFAPCVRPYVPKLLKCGFTKPELAGPTLSELYAKVQLEKDIKESTGKTWEAASWISISAMITCCDTTHIKLFASSGIFGAVSYFRWRSNTATKESEKRLKMLDECVEDWAGKSGDSEFDELVEE